MIVNVSAFVGRLSPGLYANTLGVDNAVTISAGCCSILIFGMIGVKSVTSVAVIGIIYGFFAGVCETSFIYLFIYCDSPQSVWNLDLSLFRHIDVGSLVRRSDRRYFRIRVSSLRFWLLEL